MNSDWDDHMSAAFDWFWENAARGMSKTLDTIDRDDSHVLRESWEDAKARHSNEELGDRFYKELVTIAPHVIHLFKRPRRIQAFQVCVCMYVCIGFITRSC